MTMQDHAEPSANDIGTVPKIDTPETHPSSRIVLEMAYRDLSVKRRLLGAETREGRLLSNLLVQIRNYQNEVDPIARANLERLMDWQLREIERIARTA